MGRLCAGHPHQGLGLTKALNITRPCSEGGEKCIAAPSYFQSKDYVMPTQEDEEVQAYHAQRKRRNGSTGEQNLNSKDRIIIKNKTAEVLSL